jgi:hypothetical protein
MRGVLALVNLIRHRLTPLLTGGERHHRPSLPDRAASRFCSGPHMRVLTRPGVISSIP